MKASAQSKQIVLKEKPIPSALENYVYSTLKIDQSRIDNDKVRNDAIRQEYVIKKALIQSKHLQEVSFKDLYEFPFKSYGYSQVYDNDDNFIFQFEIDNKETRQKCLDIINGDLVSTKENSFVHKGGTIYLVKDEDNLPLIIIRGWGNLTGTGAYNLDEKYACEIQDTLAEYIVDKLTFSAKNN
jgi:hypothetical protein